MSNKKSIWTWLGEALLIFVSVLGAFWIEDYRHNRQEYRDYVNVLINFRNDVNKDVVDFRYALDTTLLGGGTYLYLEDYLNRAYQVLEDNSSENDYQVFEILQEGNWVTVDWRNQSEYFPILSDYSKYLINDSLISTLRSYEHVMNLESQIAEDWNSEISKYHSFVENNVNLQEYSRTKKEVSSSIFIRNWIINTRDYNQGRLQFDGSSVRKLREIRTTLDECLRLHGVDPSRLSREPDKPSFMN